MPQMSHVPGSSLTISGCIGLIHLPASVGIHHPAARGDLRPHRRVDKHLRLQLAVGLGTLTRTLTVRVLSFSTG